MVGFVGWYKTTFLQRCHRNLHRRSLPLPYLLLLLPHLLLILSYLHLAKAEDGLKLWKRIDSNNSQQVRRDSISLSPSHTRLLALSPISHSLPISVPPPLPLPRLSTSCCSWILRSSQVTCWTIAVWRNSRGRRRRRNSRPGRRRNGRDCSKWGNTIVRFIDLYEIDQTREV